MGDTSVRKSKVWYNCICDLQTPPRKCFQFNFQRTAKISLQDGIFSKVEMEVFSQARNKKDKCLKLGKLEASVILSSHHPL